MFYKAESIEELGLMLPQGENMNFFEGGINAINNGKL